MENQRGVHLEKQQDNYTDTFDARGDLYNAAARIQPTARELERSLLIELMDVAADHVVCDVPAGGGYLANGLQSLISDPATIVCVEPSVKFSEPIASDYTTINCPITEIPVDDNHFDRIGSLAGLHHVD